MAGDPIFILDVGWVLAEMGFLRFGARVIDAVDEKEGGAPADGIPQALRDDEWHEGEPVGQIFCDVGGVFGPAVGAVGQDASVGEVGKAAAENDGGRQVYNIEREDG